MFQIASLKDVAIHLDNETVEGLLSVKCKLSPLPGVCICQVKGANCFWQLFSALLIDKVAVCFLSSTHHPFRVRAWDWLELTMYLRPASILLSSAPDLVLCCLQCAPSLVVGFLTHSEKIPNEPYLCTDHLHFKILNSFLFLLPPLLLFYCFFQCY